MRPRIKVVLQGVSMALGHERLVLEVKKQTGIDLRVMDASELALIINSYGDKVKALGGSGQVFAYLKMPKGRKLMKEAIQFLPRVFGGEDFTYDDACHEALKTISWNHKLKLPPNLPKTKWNNAFIKEASRNGL